MRVISRIPVQLGRVGARGVKAVVVPGGDAPDAGVHVQQVRRLAEVATNRTSCCDIRHGMLQKGGIIMANRCS